MSILSQSRMYPTSGGAVYGLETDLSDLKLWKATVTQVREVILDKRIGAVEQKAGFNTSLTAPRQREVEFIAQSCISGVQGGRLMDFGFLPNAVIQKCGKRGGSLYNRGALVMPFRDPWLLYHTWEGGVSVYLIHLLEPDNLAGGDFEVCILEPVNIAGHNVLVISERAIITKDEDGGEGYFARAIPAPSRFQPGANNLGGAPEMAAAANCVDPVITALLILATRGVRRETISADLKLQKARVKSGKRPIPSHEWVQTDLYVTAISADRSRERGEAQGGHHASPIPHLRQGHPRKYADGRVSLILDTLVNVDPKLRAEFKSQRSHYVVKGSPNV